jgi:hypothetical protein
MGKSGAAPVTAGALVSMFRRAQMLRSPRLAFALGNIDFLPSFNSPRYLYAMRFVLIYRNHLEHGRWAISNRRLFPVARLLCMEFMRVASRAAPQAIPIIHLPNSCEHFVAALRYFARAVFALAGDGSSSS